MEMREERDVYNGDNGYELGEHDGEYTELEHYLKSF